MKSKNIYKASGTVNGKTVRNIIRARFAKDLILAELTEFERISKEEKT